MLPKSVATGASSRVTIGKPSLARKTVEAVSMPHEAGRVVSRTMYASLGV